MAAFAVFAFHCLAFFEGDSRTFLEFIFGQGRSGVTFFFILSGFMLAWVWKPTDTARRFYRRRFARVYPAYLASLVIAAAILLAVDPVAIARGWFAPFLLQAWIPTSYYYLGLSVVAWSLSVEAFFYLVFPAVARLLHPRATRPLWYVASGCVALTIALAVLASPAVADSGLSSNAFTVWLVYYFPVARLPEFVFGMTLGFLLARDKLPAVNWWAAITVSAAAYLAAGVWTNAFSVVAMVVVPFAALIVAAAQRDLKGVPGLLNQRWAIQLGAMSYCFYLVHHLFVLRLAQEGVRNLGIDGLISVALAFALASVTAWILHRFVEQPMERRLSGRVSITDAGASKNPA